MTKSILLTTAAACLLSGCATLFGDSSDRIAIHSPGNAHILVNGNEVGQGQAVYALPRDKTATITAHKKGCNDAVVTTEQTVNPTTFLNVFFWPGFIVDAVTGKISEAEPKDYTVTPNCSMG